MFYTYSALRYKKCIFRQKRNRDKKFIIQQIESTIKHFAIYIFISSYIMQ